MTGEYKEMKLFIAPRQSALTLEKKGDIFYITGYIEEEYKPRHPHLFIKKDQALLRLNRLTYFPVVIPDKFVKSIKSLSSIELLLTSSCSDYSIETEILISSVLVFPEIYTLSLTECKNNTTSPVKEADDDARQDNGVKWNELDAEDGFLHFNMSKDETLRISKTMSSADQYLAEWLKNHKHICAFMRHKIAEYSFSLVSNDDTVFLVCSFGYEKNILVREQWDSTYSPMWHCDDGALLSPVFAAKAIADFLRCSIGRTIQVVVLFGENAHFLNEEAFTQNIIYDDLCLCTIDSEYTGDVFENFDHCMARLLQQEKVFAREQINALREIFGLQNEELLKKIISEFAHVFSISSELPEKSDLKDAVSVWMTENHCDCIWLGRYYSREDNHYFSLIYANPGVAIFLEDQWTPGETRGDPTESVLAIRDKLIAFAPDALVTPCVMLDWIKPVKEFSDDVVYFGSHHLFTFKDDDFRRAFRLNGEAQTGHNEAMALVLAANKNYKSCCSIQTLPKETPVLRERLFNLIYNLPQYNLLPMYGDANFMENSCWYVIYPEKRLMIAFKIFETPEEISEKTITECVNNFSDSYCRDKRGVPQFTEFETLVIVPDAIFKGYEKIFYAAIDVYYVTMDSMPELVTLLLND